MEKYKFGTDSKQSFDNKFDVDSYLFDSFKNFRNFNAYKPKTYSESEKIDMSKVVKFEVGKGGKHIFTMEDGTTVEKHLSEEALQRFQESPMANVSSIVNKDGWVITYDKSGNVIEDRDAHKGERGYVKDGLSIEEDLVEQLGTKRIQKFSEDKEKIADEIKELQTELATLTDDYIAGVAAQNPKEAEKLKRRRTAIENEITKKCDKQDKLKTKLTDDYIRNLENYLNSQEKDIRLSAAKEVYSRLEEDTSRKDDKALTALINKMLQDPSEEIRVLAMAALQGRIVTGDDFTVGVLTRMQNDKAHYGMDAVDASNILLKMSGQQVEKEVPVTETSKKKEKTETKEETKSSIKK